MKTYQEEQQTVIHLLELMAEKQRLLLSRRLFTTAAAWMEARDNVDARIRVALDLWDSIGCPVPAVWVS